LTSQSFSCFDAVTHIFAAPGIIQPSDSLAVAPSSFEPLLFIETPQTAAIISQIQTARKYLNERGRTKFPCGLFDPLGIRTALKEKELGSFGQDGALVKLSNETLAAVDQLLQRDELNKFKPPGKANKHKVAKGKPKAAKKAAAGDHGSSPVIVDATASSSAVEAVAEKRKSPERSQQGKLYNGKQSNKKRARK
jgi:hypothetical protein